MYHLLVQDEDYSISFIAHHNGSPRSFHSGEAAEDFAKDVANHTGCSVAIIEIIHTVYPETRQYPVACGDTC